MEPRIPFSHADGGVWAQAPGAAPGHFDELRGRCAPLARGQAGDERAPGWRQWLQQLGDVEAQELDRRYDSLQRMIRDNGVTYNVYADVSGPQRPWALDLFPMLVEAEDWSVIEAGVLQRVRLLEAVMADVYGPQRLTRQALLPQALVQGHPGYLRPLHGMKPQGGTHLHIAAFDLARGPNGQWSVVSQRTQAPSGLGYLLENRNCISMQFAGAFQSLGVRSLAAPYKALMDGLLAACPELEGGPKRIVLLTPGPYNETYFEHAYLARHLGLSLVQGGDLLVRDERLYLKTLGGLEPVHGVLKRLDDEFLDPLELRSDSALGVPGLLQVVRAGQVLLANAPGSAFLESPALLGFLPALSQELLGQSLQLPSLPTWWCGEPSALQAMLPQLRACVIKPTYPSGHGESVIARDLAPGQLDEWAERIVRSAENHTAQAYMPLSQTPVWQRGSVLMRSAMLRVFALSRGPGSWHVLPGGLVRLAGRSENIASMQQGGSSADLWVLGATAAQADTARAPAPTALQKQTAVGSRAAENLFWLGRYTERAENCVRLAQLALHSLNGPDQGSPPLLAWLSQMAVQQGLVLPDVPPATQSRRVFERALLANLADLNQAPSVGFNLQAMKNAASNVRERLSQSQWQTIVAAEQDFRLRCAGLSEARQQAWQGAAYPISDTLGALESTSQVLAAITGAQVDRMMRDDGWLLLSMGRLIERLGTLASALSSSLATQALAEDGGFRGVLVLFDSTITFESRHPQNRELHALLDLLVLDTDNPRSLTWVVQTLRNRLGRLAASTSHGAALAHSLSDPSAWSWSDLRSMAWPSPQPALQRHLDDLSQAAWALSESIGRRYFSHVDTRSLSA